MPLEQLVKKLFAGQIFPDRRRIAEGMWWDNCAHMFLPRHSEPVLFPRSVAIPNGER